VCLLNTLDNNIRQQICPLFAGKTADKTKQRQFGIQTIFCTEFLFIFPFALARISCAEVIIKIHIGSRVPNLSINTVNDAKRFLMFLLYKIFQTSEILIKFSKVTS